MAPTSRNHRLLLAAPLVPLLALVTAAGFLGYRLLTRPTGSGGTTPEPVIVGVIASFPGASPEEVERQVTIPLEVAFAGAPHLQTVRSQSSAGMASLRLRFDDGADYYVARQEVINRLAVMGPPLPAGVTPQLFGVLPHHEIFRYTLAGPAAGRPVYTLYDLRTLQDWVIEREFRRLPRIADSEGRGGATKRYEVNPDPDRLRRFDITLRQLQDAVVNANRNVGGDVVQGPVMLNVRGVGLFGGGEDPLAQVRGMKDPDQAAARLREEEGKRVREIRGIVITSVNNHDVLLEDVVEGGRLGPDLRPGARGVVVGARRQGDVALGEGPAWRDEERVEGVVFLRRGEDTEAALRDVRARVEQMNAGDVLLPGVRIEPLVERGGRPEDGFWMLAEFPRNIAPDRLAQDLRELRALLGRQAEVAAVLTETDGPDAAAPQPGSAAVFVRLKPPGAGARGTGRLVKDMSDEVSRNIPGVILTFTNSPPDNFALAFDAMPGEVLLKLFGRDLDELQQVVARVAEALRRTQGVEDLRPVDGSGATRVEWRVDPQKCKKWGVSADDVNAVTQAALDGKAVSSMIEGEKLFDITVRWRAAEGTAILDLPLDVINHQLVPADGPGPNAAAPRIRLRDLVSPLGKDGAPDPEGAFERAGVTAVYRENGQRCVAVRFRLATPHSTGYATGSRR